MSCRRAINRGARETRLEFKYSAGFLLPSPPRHVARQQAGTAKADGQRHGLKFKTAEMEFSDEDAASVWIIDNQKGRRNVSEIDRIMLASKREEIISRKAKVNLKTSTGGNAPRPLAKLPKAAKVNTRRESAKAAGVGERTYDAGKLILKSVEDGTIKPEVLEDVRRGRAAIHRVAKDIKEKIQRDNRAKTPLPQAAIQPPARRNGKRGWTRQSAGDVGNQRAGNRRKSKAETRLNHNAR